MNDERNRRPACSSVHRSSFRLHRFRPRRPMPDPVGFIGLGNLGLPIATNVLALGHPLRVYNRTPDKAAPLVAKGVTLADTPAATATRGGIVVSVVSDDAALEAIADDALAS